MVAFCMPPSSLSARISISLVCRSIQILTSYTAIPSVGERGSQRGTRNNYTTLRQLWAGRGEVTGERDLGLVSPNVHTYLGTQKVELAIPKMELTPKCGVINHMYLGVACPIFGVTNSIFGAGTFSETYVPSPTYGSQRNKW